MIISDLNYLETVTEEVQGGSGKVSGNNFKTTYEEKDKISITFNSYNNFALDVHYTGTKYNNASAGAKGDAINNSHYPSWSFTKADTLAVAKLGGGSFSGSTSVAVIQPIH